MRRGFHTDIYIYYAIERGSSGQVHIHALFGGWKGAFTPMNLAALKRLWRQRFWGGEVYADRFRPHKGGVRYSLKEMKARPEDWDIVGLPKPVRTRGRGRKKRRNKT